MPSGQRPVWIRATTRKPRHIGLCLLRCDYGTSECVYYGAVTAHWNVSTTGQLRHIGMCLLRRDYGTLECAYYGADLRPATGQLRHIGMCPPGRIFDLLRGGSSTCYGSRHEPTCRRAVSPRCSSRRCPHRRCGFIPRPRLPANHRVWDKIGAATLLLGKWWKAANACMRQWPLTETPRR